MIYEHVLHGCAPVPLASYLKALGIQRLIGEQADGGTRARWDGDQFVLRTTLDRDALEAFLLNDYAPTPVVAPWNGGSGFYPKDNQRSIEAIAASSNDRLRVYRHTIELARDLMRELGLTEKAEGESKVRLLQACRANLPDAALDWLDAALLLTDEAPKYPPLLGTGGNDGRLDFTNNFMQRLLDLVDPVDGHAAASAKQLLASALFAETTNCLVSGPVGQFMPGTAGGANAAAGFSGDALVNPWDFVLMIEGALTFAAAAVRKMEHTSKGALSYPFTVRPVGAGYASASDADEGGRAEMWMPLWERWASAREIQQLLSEGRARVGKRSALNGVDLARAVRGLGTDRGIAAFQRYSFQVRNGLAYLAVPLNRFPVQYDRHVDLFHEIDRWLQSFRHATSSAPASALRALHRLETAILTYCQQGDTRHMQNVLIALGHCERVMATSRKWTAEARLRPIPSLSPQWLAACRDDSVEFRLAASLASVQGVYADGEGRPNTVFLRCNLEPVRTPVFEKQTRVFWDDMAGRDVVWSPGPLVPALNAVMRRRLTRAVQSGKESYADRGQSAALADIAAFVEGRVDEKRLADLLWACILIDWVQARLPRRDDSSLLPGAFYALLKLCHLGSAAHLTVRADETDGDGATGEARLPVVPQIHRLAALGQGAQAARQAIRRLRASGFSPAVKTFGVTRVLSERSAAALLFPVAQSDVWKLSGMLLRPDQKPNHSSQEGVTA